MRFHARGKMTAFGGPSDAGVGPKTGLALVQESDVERLKEYFLAEPPLGVTGLARRLNPDALYIACRWDYKDISKEELTEVIATVTNPLSGVTAAAKPVDWGPKPETGRVAGLSPALIKRLGLQTDDDVDVSIV